MPLLQTAPRAIPTMKTPAFFECRNNEVFYVDKDALDKQVSDALASVPPEMRKTGGTEFLKALERQEIGNQFYKVEPHYLIMGRMSLQPRDGIHGESIQMIGQPDSQFIQALRGLDQQSRYLAFLVRDDSFSVFRKARAIADREGFDTNWELFGAGEAIRFGPASQTVPSPAP